MKLSGKRAGLALLGAAYALSAFLVFRHAAKEAEPGTVTIRICQWQLETGVREAIGAMIRRYEQINPRVRVEQIAVPGGPVYVSWVLTQMAGGTAPDLVQYDISDPDVALIFQPISGDVTTPNPYNRGTALEGVPWKNTFIDGMISNFDPYLHEYYSISLDTHMARIIYNRPLMKAITGSDEPPRTYRAMLALCGKVRAYARDRGIKLEPMANSPENSQLQTWLIAIALTNGLCERIDYVHRLITGPGDLGRAYLRGDWSYDTPEAVAVLQELKEYGAMCTPGFWNRPRDAAVTDFVSGRTLMIVAPSWEATNLLGLAPFRIAAFPFPYPREDDPVYGRYAKGPLSEAQIITGMPIYLNRSTKHRAEAIDFLHFMTSQEGSTIFTQVSNWPPATIGVAPSGFASQFKLQTDGYCWNGNLMVPTSEQDSKNFILTQMVELWGANGSVDRFRRVMREGLGPAIRADLLHEAASGLDNLRRVDAEAAARMELEAPGRRSRVLRVLPVFNESTVLYQNRVVAEPLSDGPLEPPPYAGDLPGPNPALPGISGSGERGECRDPGLAAGWRALAEHRTEKAIGIFTPGLEAADPAVAREASLGRGICLLDRQPVSEGQVAAARDVFAALAGSGGDDAALGARFFLGRIAQHHLKTPDPAEAARQYSLLISGHPHSLWAQTALPRLALLDIYALDLRAAPEVRLARAEKLLAFASTPEAESDLHVVLSQAVFFYRLPAAGALPHLLAAARLDQLDAALRKDVLVQAAELSRLSGNTPQAALYYRKFLEENPNDYRRTLIRERLVACASHAATPAR
jgi:raffinose/stachyose/melibiose transport system substrate-binding protein